MKCKQCNTDYEGKGRSLYCSTACKQLFYRNRLSNVTQSNVTPVTIATEQPVTITDKPKHLDRGHNGDAAIYRMTVMERLFYRPASRLKPGEHNFVSLPRRACYDVY